jgi:hypothetical protein
VAIDVSVVVETRTLSRFDTEQRPSVLAGTLECIWAGDAPAEVVVVAAEAPLTAEFARVVQRYPGTRLVALESPTIYRMKNAGTECATSEVVAFADADCRVSKAWVGAIARAFDDAGVDGSAGRTRYESSGLLSRVASATDFGFVQPQPDGSATGVIAHNLALRRSVALEFPFDERFVKTGACGHLFQRLTAAGKRVVFNRDQLVIHTDDWRRFRWLAKRVRNGADIAKVGDLAPPAAVERWTPRGTIGFPLHVAARRAAGDVIRLAREDQLVARPAERPAFIAAAVAGRALEGVVGALAERRPAWVSLGARWG